MEEVGSNSDGVRKHTRELLRKACQVPILALSWSISWARARFLAKVDGFVPQPRNVSVTPNPWTANNKP